MSFSSSAIEFRRLTADQINRTVVDEINELLAMQHSNTRPMTKETLFPHLTKAKIIVACQDGRVIGMGTLFRNDCFNYEFASIHHLVVGKGYDMYTIGIGLLEALIKDISGVNFIEAGAWLQGPGMEEILMARGFKQKPEPRFRLKFPVKTQA